MKYPLKVYCDFETSGGNFFYYYGFTKDKVIFILLVIGCKR
jgi:hypothetical protein